MQVAPWNRLPRVEHAEIFELFDRFAPLPTTAVSLLPFGNGRSYGDVCLNAGGALLRTRHLNRFIAFDRTSGCLSCEGGVLLKEILDLIVPQGFFLPVTPGTQYVTVGGAIANDVHGKNHHLAGSFGYYIRRVELLRSDGSRLICSPTENSKWFFATIGGLGLTGLITFAEIQLIPIANPYLLTQTLRFRTLEEFWALEQETKDFWPYLVAWIDCTSPTKRGLLFAGCHAPPQETLPNYKPKSFKFPIDMPCSLIHPLTLRLFNALYYRFPRKPKTQLRHYAPFFYPLDKIRQWNRLYGKRGFYQYQCVIPPVAAKQGIACLLEYIAKSGEGSFLAVLKNFGDKSGAGMLSFPRPGVTLALDFPNRGEQTLRLFRNLDAIVAEAGGAIYPAKDARMPGKLFRAAYPKWEAFTSYIDPKFSSSFWRRVTQ